MVRFGSLFSKSAWRSCCCLCDGILEGLEGASAGDVASRLGREFDGLTSEGVASHAGLAGLLALEHKFGAAVKGERLLGSDLVGDQLLERGDNGLDVLLVGLGEGGEGHNDLSLRHVLTLRLGDGHDWKWKNELAGWAWNGVVNRLVCSCRKKKHFFN